MDSSITGRECSPSKWGTEIVATREEGGAKERFGPGDEIGDDITFHQVICFGIGEDASARADKYMLH